jgi:hypothetical protein
MIIEVADQKPIFLARGELADIIRKEDMKELPEIFDVFNLLKEV